MSGGATILYSLPFMVDREMLKVFVHKMSNNRKTPRLEETQQICSKHVVFFKNLAEVQSQNLPKHQEQFFRDILEG